jgi:hypothetical protein
MNERSRIVEISVKRNSQAKNDNQPLKKETKSTPENRKRLDPTRYGDWEKNGRCIDF